MNMSSDLKLYIHTPEGQSQAVDAPRDMMTRDFLKDITEGLGLVAVDADQNPVSWQIVNKETSTQLDPDRSLEANGVANEHHLYLRRTVVAGSRHPEA